MKKWRTHPTATELSEHISTKIRNQDNKENSRIKNKNLKNYYVHISRILIFWLKYKWLKIFNQQIFNQNTSSIELNGKKNGRRNENEDLQ